MPGALSLNPGYSSQSALRRGWLQPFLARLTTPFSTSASAQSPQFSQLARRFRVAIPTYGPKADENHKTRVEPRHASLYLHYSRIPHLRRNSPIYFAALPGSTTIVAVMRGCSEQKYW